MLKCLFFFHTEVGFFPTVFIFWKNNTFAGFKIEKAPNSLRGRPSSYSWPIHPLYPSQCTTTITSIFHRFSLMHVPGTVVNSFPFHLWCLQMRLPFSLQVILSLGLFSSIPLQEPAYEPIPSALATRGRQNSPSKHVSISSTQISCSVVKN